jgi:hypothetical protein
MCQVSRIIEYWTYNGLCSKLHTGSLSTYVLYYMYMVHSAPRHSLRDTQTTTYITLKMIRSQYFYYIANPRVSHPVDDSMLKKSSST